MITAAFGRPSHFVDYYEAPRWAEGVNGVLQDRRGLLDDGQADAVVTLAEYAFERADKATQHVDASEAGRPTSTTSPPGTARRAASRPRSGTRSGGSEAIPV